MLQRERCPHSLHSLQVVSELMSNEVTPVCLPESTLANDRPERLDVVQSVIGSVQLLDAVETEPPAA